MFTKSVCVLLLYTTHQSSQDTPKSRPLPYMYGYISMCVNSIGGPVSHQLTRLKHFVNLYNCTATLFAANEVVFEVHIGSFNLI